MNKQLATAMLLVGTLTMTQYAEAMRLPDYWNQKGDRRYLSDYTWEAADNERYGNATSWQEETQTNDAYKAYQVPVDMTTSEESYRKGKFGQRGLGAAQWAGNQWGMSEKQGQLNDMHDYIQTTTEGGGPGEERTAEGEKPKKPTEGEKEAHSPPSMRYQWWKRGDPAEKVSFVDPIIARQQTTFYAQDAKADEDAKIFGGDEVPVEKVGPAPRLNGYKGSHKLPAEKVFFIDPVTSRQHTTLYSQTGDVEVVGAPEKVHVLEPEAYQATANANKPNQRTTFYNKNGAVSFAQEDGDKAKAEAAADEAKKAPAQKEEFEQKSAAAAKAGDKSEKTSIIEPMAYERRDNYNKIDGKVLFRTTFYGQQDSQQHLAQFAKYNEKDGLWMLVQEDGDAKKAEDAAAEKAKAPALAEEKFISGKKGDKVEKVSVIEPMAYERRNNYNKIDGKTLFRTTFYSQKEPELIQHQPNAFYNERDGVWMLTMLD